MNRTAALPEGSRAIAGLLCPALPDHGDREAFWQFPWAGFLFDSRRDSGLPDWISASGRDVLVCADLERGAGQHLSGAELAPHAWVFGEHDNLDATRMWGAWTAREARLAGVNWVLAPVADVQTHSANPIVQTRAFGSDPQRVARHVSAFTLGVQGAGAMACAKHFPGHGDTGFDTHVDAGIVEVSVPVWETREAVPFQAAIDAGVDSVMLAHLAMPCLDPVGSPASVSAPVIRRLRNMGFEGLVVTDALDMGAIAGNLDPGEAAVRAVAAGVDVLLMPADPISTLGALVRAVDSGRLPEHRVRDALERQARMRNRRQAPPVVAPLEAERVAFQALMAEVARGALRVQGGPPGSGSWQAMAPVIVDAERGDSGSGAVARLFEARCGLSVPVFGWDDLTLAREWVDRLEPSRLPVLVHLSGVRAWKGDPALPQAWRAWFLTFSGGSGFISFTREPWLQETKTQAWTLQAWADHPACHEAVMAWLDGVYW